MKPCRTATPRTAPTATAEVDARLTALEIKASFAEDLLDSLNAVIVRQQDEIDGLRRELVRLREQGPSGDAAPPRSLRDDLPPHY